MAVGQVLRYMQQLAYTNKPIVPIIAVERKPYDASWIDLCNSLGIT
jgi:hypothetical protein